METIKSVTLKILLTSSVLVLTTSCSLFSFSKNKNKSNEKVDLSADIEQLHQTKPLGLTGNLQSFASCDEVLVRLKDDLAQQLSAELVSQMIWVNEYNEEVYAKSSISPKSANNDESEESAGGPDGSDGASNDNNSPSEHSETNNQVAGVEEADIVKTDGTYIYQAARGKLRIVKSWPANQLAEANSMDLDLRPIELFLDKERKKVVVIGNKIEQTKPSDNTDSETTQKEEMESSSGIFIDVETVLVAIIDVTDPAKPVLQSRHSYRGSYNSSRRVGGAVRFILQASTRYPDGIETYLTSEQSNGRSKKEQIDTLRAMLAAGREKIMAQDLNFFLNLDGFTKEKAGVVSNAINIGTCQNIHAPTVASPSGFTHVLTLNLDSEEVTSTSVMTYANTIYASETSLYLAAQYYWRLPMFDDGHYSFIHKLDISKSETATYLGSGQIEGYLLNQFSMDEHENNLRVAVTVPITEKINESSEPGNDDEDEQEWTDSTVNRVSIMSLDGDVLKVVGTTPDLAKGERIYSVRFNGKKGFVVTFRQVDPLYTLDLSNPAEPKVVGELKIPGYSSYLHMLDENHLLAVGRAGTDEGQIQGLKLSIFDVTDMANPKESHSFVMDESTYSEAEWDHKAFTYFPSKKLLGIPVSGRSGIESEDYDSNFYSKIAIFGIDTATGITDKGSLGMNDIYSGVNGSDTWWYGGAHVRRSIFADDFVYAISDLGIRAANINDLTNPVGTVRYQCDKTCFEHWYWW
jgi:hypothetical protein